MKTMTCRELGGACEQAFSAETFEAIAEQSKTHARQKLAERDPDHLQAMQEMAELMQVPDQLEAWMNEKRRLFDSLPDGSASS